MTEPDIVAELDRWLGHGIDATMLYAPPTLHPVLQRARDALAAHQADLITAAARARGTALEEACAVVWSRIQYADLAREVVGAIGALKDRDV